MRQTVTTHKDVLRGKQRTEYRAKAKNKANRSTKTPPNIIGNIPPRNHKQKQLNLSFIIIFRSKESKQPGMSCNWSKMLKTNDIRGKLLGSGSMHCSDYLNIPVEQFILLHGTVFFSHIPSTRRAGLSTLCAQRAGEPSGAFFIRKISVWSGKKIKLLEPLSKQTFQNHVKNW